MKKLLQIPNKKIGDQEPVFIVAEISANHLQKYELAEKTIRAACNAGADAVKFQTYTPDTMTLDATQECFQVRQGTLWDGETLYQLYERAYTPWEWQPKLKKFAEELGLIWFATPFDKTAVDFLESINNPIYKVASFEINDLSLIQYIASQGKPVILSTGIATLPMIEAAIDACLQKSNDKIALLKCTSAYPTPLCEVNLKTMTDFKKRFDVIIGLSDHTRNLSVPIASVALGAKIIEKHFILDRKLGGPDAAFSLEPQEFSEMTKAVRDTEKILGDITYHLTPSAEKMSHFSRSLFVSENIKKGESFTTENIRLVRPANGLSPSEFEKVIGKKASKDLKKGEPLSWDLICN